MGPKRATALKNCPSCTLQIPTACKSCSCGHNFRKTPTSSPAESPADGKRRRTERTRRERPHYFSHLEYEHTFKKRRKRTGSESTTSGSTKKKKGPKGSTTVQAGTSEARAKLLFKNKSSAGGSGDTGDDANSSHSNSNSEDMFASISTERALQFAIILADVNRKYVGQNFKPA